MDQDGLHVLVFQVEQLRKTNRSLWALCIASSATLFALILLALSRTNSVSASTTDVDGVMHVRGLVIVDAAGHERVRLGAPLPDPLIRGVRVKRNGVLSGILLTDSTGTERGGYVTEEEGEAFLTLDSRHGQEMTLLSNADGGVNFDIQDPKRNEAQITVFLDGPKFSLKRAGHVVAELPFAAK